MPGPGRAEKRQQPRRDARSAENAANLQQILDCYAPRDALEIRLCHDMADALGEADRWREMQAALLENAVLIKLEDHWQRTKTEDWALESIIQSWARSDELYQSKLAYLEISRGITPTTAARSIAVAIQLQISAIDPHIAACDQRVMAAAAQLSRHRGVEERMAFARARQAADAAKAVGLRS
jgi:hypothetical protein